MPTERVPFSAFAARDSRLPVAAAMLFDAGTAL